MPPCQLQDDDATTPSACHAAMKVRKMEVWLLARCGVTLRVMATILMCFSGHALYLGDLSFVNTAMTIAALPFCVIGWSGHTIYFSAALRIVIAVLEGAELVQTWMLSQDEASKVLAATSDSRCMIARAICWFLLTVMVKISTLPRYPWLARAFWAWPPTMQVLVVCHFWYLTHEVLTTEACRHLLVVRLLLCALVPFALGHLMYDDFKCRVMLPLWVRARQRRSDSEV